MLPCLQKSEMVTYAKYAPISFFLDGVATINLKINFLGKNNCQLSIRQLSILLDGNRENEVARANIVNHILAFDNLTEAGVNAIEVLCVAAIVADKEL